MKDSGTRTASQHISRHMLSTVAMAVLLSGCVSAVSPVSQLETSQSNTNNGQTSDQTADQTAIAANSGEQQLATLDDGTVLAVPQRNPALATAPVSADLSDANSHLEAPQDQENRIAANGGNESNTQETAVLALVVPQKNPLHDESTDPVGTDTSIPATRDTAQLTASKNATETQATGALKRPSFFARLFRRPPAKVGVSDDRNNPLLASRKTASASNTELRTGSASLMKMPGVRPTNEILGAKPDKTGKLPTIQLASVAGLARLSPLGLRTQHSGVNVSCIRPEILMLLNNVERHYGKKPIVTSGYRNPSRNRKAGGARNSMHIYCKAVDIQVEGVSKWDLAKYMRSIPGRGGVGTYCRTKSVHIDIGPKRDWHYSCRRKSKRRKA